MRVALLGLAIACKQPAIQEPSAWFDYQPDTIHPDLVVVALASARGDLSETLERAVQRPPTVRFANAHAQSVLTIVSLGSLLTGRYPSAIPMCGLISRTLADHPEQPWCARIPEGVTTLPEVLSAYGYQTGLIHSGVAGASFLEQTFSWSEDRTQNWSNAQSDWLSIQTSAQQWWQSAEGNPRLLMVITNDLDLGNRPDLVLSIRKPRSAHALFIRGADISPKRVRATYDTELDSLTQQLRQLMAGLSADRPRWTVLTGLHGTDLGEPKGTKPLPPKIGFHDIVLERTTHIPLLAWAPEPTHHTTEVIEPVELIDLLPTLTAMVGAHAPASSQGISLFDSGLVTDPERSAYTETGDMLSIRQNGYRYTYRGVTHHQSALDPALTKDLMRDPLPPRKARLHHVVVDPGQEIDLIRSSDSTEKDIASHLLETMRTIRVQKASPPKDLLTDQRILELKLTETEGYW